MNNILLKIKDAIKDPRSSALCIIVQARGSVPGKIGAKMIVYSDGRIEGTVGGGGIEKQAMEDALTAIHTQKPLLKEYNLQTDLGMTCGGAATIYIEPLSKPSRLYIFGAGHIGKILANYAPDMHFETYLIDWRTELFESAEHLRYQQICKPYLEAVNEIPFDRESYIVIVTPNHNMDEDILAAVGKKDVAYLGLIGSKRKIETLTKTFLKENKLTKEELDRVDMPIGIKFNAITPAEIAISILARLIDEKNNRLSF
ncbi:MAG: XdhC family protein [Bacteroidetes bacterium]|nr:XdhC family protein [Bacteroidota bacterium]